MSATNSPPILPGSPARSSCTIPPATSISSINEPQSKTVVPCSTFKIYNSLIGLETGVLDQEDVYTLFKWDAILSPTGTTIIPGIGHRESVVWYFQELAARIGPERMQEYIDKIGYGNTSPLAA